MNNATAARDALRTLAIELAEARGFDAMVEYLRVCGRGDDQVMFEATVRGLHQHLTYERGAWLDVIGLRNAAMLAGVDLR